MTRRYNGGALNRHIVTKTRNVHLLSGEGDERAAEYGLLIREAARGDREALERLLVRAQEVAFRLDRKSVV